MLRRCSVSEVQLDMKYIGARCPDMEEFTVHEDSNRAQLSETLRSCKRLRRLQCPPFDSAAWMHLSTIPTLLEVKIYTPRTIHYPLDNLDFATFLHLTTLSLSGAIEAASAVAIVQHFKFPSLKEFGMLFAALRLCPQLQDLQVSIDTRNIVIKPEVESFQHISLRNLTIDSCELETVNVEVVARIIYSMLPAVDQRQIVLGAWPLHHRSRAGPELGMRKLRRE
ncbi:hypothetical protein EV424DRAFT_1342876 [Suillus variegatus]|nr:hypothetical protein EV424DRAFT_1342876 [Suillus variegatus]